MNAEDGVILWLSRTTAAHRPLVGGKAAALGELARAGFPVTNGFTVTTRAYQGFLKDGGLVDPITRRLYGLSPDNPGKLQTASTRLQKQVAQTKLPKDVAAGLRSAYQKLGGGSLAVWVDRVRHEDDPGAEAGYLLTLVNVVGDGGVVQALKAGWAATFSPRSLHYLASLGLGVEAVAPAVSFQQTVEAEVSGILMTLDPIYGDPSRVVVEAVWGLNGVLNEAPVTPEVHLLDKVSGHPIARRTGEQDHKLVYNPSAARGEPFTLDVPLSAAEVGCARLSERQLADLAALGRAAEAQLGVPVEIEWAKEASTEEFRLLQVRPLEGFVVTGQPAARIRGEMTGKLLLTGAPASPGLCSGKVRVLANPEDTDGVRAGDVVVLRGALAGFDAAVRRAGAVVMDQEETGTQTISLCEELGIPCVCGTGMGSTILKADQTVTVDGTWGRVLEGVVVLKAGRHGRQHHPSHLEGVSANPPSRLPAPAPQHGSDLIL